MSRASSYLSSSKARHASASVELGWQCSLPGSRSVRMDLTNFLKDGKPAGMETPAPQKNTTSPSSWLRRSSSGIKSINPLSVSD